MEAILDFFLRLQQWRSTWPAEAALTVLTAILLVLGAVAVLWSVYYALLLVAAAAQRARERQDPPIADPQSLPSFCIVIPAHNEELVLGATLESLRQLDYPRHLVEVVVVADNCTDSTALLARQRGATVLERHDASQRGKGYALNWAFARLLARPATAGAYAIVDADTWVSPDFLRAMAARCGTPRELWALQGRYGVLNGAESWRAELMSAAFELCNHIRLLAGERLGATASLKGNGMAFSPALLRRAPWQGRSITEDLDYGLDLLIEHGIRVQYVPQAVVRAQMPTTARQAVSQRERWEGGRYAILRRRLGELLRAAARRRDLRLVEAAISLAAPPLAELAALLALWGLAAGMVSAFAFTAMPEWWTALWAPCVAAFAAYVLGGLALAGAPGRTYLALLAAPFYVGWKLGLYVLAALRRPRGRGREAEWIRTARASIASPGAEPRGGGSTPTP